MKNIYILITILLLVLIASSLRITEGFDDKSCPELSEIDKQIDELNKQKEDTKKSCVKKIMLKNNIVDVSCNPEKYGLTTDDLYKYSDAYMALVKKYNNRIDIFCNTGN